MIGALLPVSFFAGQITLTGEWNDFWLSYVRFNLLYTAGSERSLADTLTATLGYAFQWDRFLPYALLGSLLWLATLVRVRAVTDASVRWSSRLALVAGLVALASVLTPHRPFLHYWQLLLVPGVWLLASVMARALASPSAAREKAERRLIAAGAIALITFMLLVRSWHPNLFVGETAAFWRSPRTPLAEHVAAAAPAGGKLAIWGRADHLYVETNLLQATRDSHDEFLLKAGPLQEYFRERYLADFLAAKPALFVDSVSPSDRHYRDAEFAHDRNFPRLAQAVQQDYVLVDNFEGVRIYRRKDLIGR